MTRNGVTDDLVHSLVTSTHAEGIVNLYGAAAVEDHDQTLLVASNDNEFDPSFELPFTAVLPGEQLLDALCRCLAPLGLNVAQFNTYLGHHDHGHAGNGARVFCFAVTATNPHAVCHAATIRHEWADLADPTLTVAVGAFTTEPAVHPIAGAIRPTRRSTPQTFPCATPSVSEHTH